MTHIDKTTWGEGRWQEEPDRAEWRDEQTGLACLAIRHPSSGHWCGYVSVQPGHPWHGVGYDDLPDDVSVHGGLTFADSCANDPEDTRPDWQKICHVPAPGESEDAWWFGFDCHHFQDLAPGFVAMERGMAARFRAEGDIASAERFEHSESRSRYCDLAYVRSECANLAGALAQAHQPSD